MEADKALSEALGQTAVVEEGCRAAVEEEEEEAAAEAVAAVAAVTAEVLAEAGVVIQAMIAARRIRRGEEMRLARGERIARRG